MNENGTNTAKAASRADELARAARQMAARVEALDKSLSTLSSERNERGARASEMRASIEGVVASIEETNATVHALARSQLEMSESARETLRGLQGSATG